MRAVLQYDLGTRAGSCTLATGPGSVAKERSQQATQIVTYTTSSYTTNPGYNKSTDLR